MDARAKDLRESRLDLLEFLGSPTHQLAWQARTPSLDSGEVLCWWAEDFTPDDDLYRSAFSPDEIALLRSFNEQLERAFDKYQQSFPTMRALLDDPDWRHVASQAVRLAGSLRQRDP
jgi:hypothetical protein